MRAKARTACSRVRPNAAVAAASAAMQVDAVTDTLCTRDAQGEAVFGSIMSPLDLALEPA